MLKKSLAVFFVAFFVVTAILFFAPIRIFDGEIVLNFGGVRHLEPAKFALREITGIGVSKEELANVEDYYLNRTGYLLLVLITVGLPALIAYRVKLTRDNRNREKQDGSNAD